jgi:branched-chain amino acid transport system permease protein
MSSLFERFEGPNVIGKSRKFWIGFWTVVALVLLYPLTAGAYGTLQMTVYFIWIFLALSLTFIWGYAGILSFGQSAFFGFSGYLFGVLGINLIQITGETAIALLLTVLTSTLFAAVLGYFMFYGRVSGVYVAIITLATTLVLELAFTRSTSITIRDATLGGYQGMTGIPSMTFELGVANVTLNPITRYYFVIAVLLVVYFVLRYVLNTDFGYSMIAIREDEDRTEMLGYDIRLLKLKVFAIGGALAGLGGGLYAAWGQFMSPPLLGLTSAALPVIWVTVGGRKTLLGPMIAAFVLQYLGDQVALFQASLSVIMVGVILIATILYMDRGAIPNLEEYILDRFESDGVTEEEEAV